MKISTAAEVTENLNPRCTLFQFEDGSIFKIYDSGEPYVSCEYPYGGYTITQWNFDYTCWIYVDNSPDMDTLTNFLKALEQRHGKCQ